MSDTELLSEFVTYIVIFSFAGGVGYIAHLLLNEEF